MIPSRRLPSRSSVTIVAVHGQKSYNGVAILSKRPIEDVAQRLPGGAGDDHARYLEAVIAGDHGVVRVASIYAPNGNPIGTEKFSYKLDWHARLADHAEELLAGEEPIALMGDFNVIPKPEDCYDPKAWEMDALFQPESRASPAADGISRLLPTRSAPAMPSPASTHSGTIRRAAGRKNRGIRIDHIFLSPQAADRLVTSGVNKHMRGRERPSDHVPVWCELAI